MGAVAGHCPPPDELSRLLAEQLSGPERDAIEAHVEGCSTCQDWLAGQVGTPPALSAARASVSPECMPPEPGAEFLDRLKRLPPGSSVSEQAITQLSAVDCLKNRRLGQYEILGMLGQGGMG